MNLAMNFDVLRIGLLLAGLFLSPLSAIAQTQPVADDVELPSLDELLGGSDKAGPAPATAQKRQTWVLILCGHPGDAEHRTLYADSIQRLGNGLVNNAGVSRDRIFVQFGGIPSKDDESFVRDAKGSGTIEELETTIAEIGQQLNPQDALWVVVMGHAHYNGRDCYLNVRGRDVQQDEFARLFANVKCEQQVFFMTTAVSGFFTRPLSQQNRVVITATQPDLEVNETLMHLALAQLFNEPKTLQEFDADGDERITLFDVYVDLARRTADLYTEEMLVATEHATIDDNGDGKGTELQLDYLTEEQGGRATAESKPPRIRENSDGSLSKSIELALVLPMEEVTEDAAEEDAAEEDAAEEDAAEEDAAEEDAAEDVAAEDVAAEDVAAEDVAAEDVAAEDVAAEDVAAEESPADTEDNE